MFMFTVTGSADDSEGLGWDAAAAADEAIDFGSDDDGDPHERFTDELFRQLDALQQQQQQQPGVQTDVDAAEANAQRQLEAAEAEARANVRACPLSLQCWPALEVVRRCVRRDGLCLRVHAGDASFLL
jgi:hypothetical protein